MTQNQMMKPTSLTFIVVGLVLITGCATHKTKAPSLKPAEPMVQVIPPQGALEPRVAEVPSKPEPIYINPVIEEVDMAAYINDDGNLVFPGKVLVIREPGHWNLAGAQKNSKYYVPADNQPPQLAPPSMSYYDYIQSRKNGQLAAHLDVSRVRVLGFAQEEERSEAESKLLPGETVAYDPRLGWLAIPAEPDAADPTPGPSPTATCRAPNLESGESSVQKIPAPTGSKAPKEQPSGPNGPAVGGRLSEAEQIKETQEQLRGIVEEAAKKAGQVHDQGTNQPTQQ